MTSHTSTSMLRALAAAIRASIPVMVWGNPGLGKTSVLESLAASWGWHAETVIGSIREPTDFLGHGVEVGGSEGAIGHVAYAPPRWARAAADADRAQVFFDELTTAPAIVRKAMLRVLQERVAGELTLPDTVTLIAAGNPPESGVDAYELEAAMANRMVHLDFDFDPKTWLDGLEGGFDTLPQPSMVDLIGEGDDAHRAQTRASVVAFLRSRLDLIDPPVPEDPTVAGKGWPSRRSWSNAVAAMAEARPGDYDAAFLLAKGAVGGAAALEYVEFRNNLDLPTPEQVVADPAAFQWRGMRPDRAYAVCGALRVYGTSGDADRWEASLKALATIADAGLPDIAQSATASLINSTPEGASIPRSVREAFEPLFEATGHWAQAS